VTGGDQEAAPRGGEPGGATTPPPLAGAVAITVVAAALWLLAVGLGFFLVGRDFAVAVALGGGVALVNFQMMWVAAARSLEGAPSTTVWTVLRWVGLGAARGAAVLLVRVDVAGLLVGLSVVVAAILLSAALGLVRG